MKRVHVAKKATASEIRGSVGVTSTHNRSAAKAIRGASAKTAVGGRFVVTRKGSSEKQEGPLRLQKSKRK